MERNFSNIYIMSKLLYLVKPLRKYMCLAILLGVCGHLVATFITIFGAYALLNASGMKLLFSNRVIFIMIVIFAIVRGLFRYGEQACNHFIAFKLLALLRSLVFRQLRKLSPAKLEGKKKGDLISLISTDIELLEVFYAHTISPIFIAILFTLCICLFLWQFDYRIALYAFFAYLLVGIAQPIFASYLSKDYGIKVRQKSGRLSTYLLDSLRGLDDIIQCQNGKKRFQNMDDLTSDLLYSQSDLRSATGKNIALSTFWVLILTIGMLLICTILYQKGELTFSALLISVFSIISSFGPTIALANLGTTLQNTFAAARRIIAVLEEQAVTEEIIGMENIAYQGAKIENITFAYPSGENIINHFSMELEKNKIYGIVGKSGSGKSTLLKLMMRFWEVNDGKITISDKNINAINTKQLRDMQSYMTQTTQLLSGSVYDNIKLAKLDATEAEVIEAAKKASIHDMISTLPNGYQTLMGELGNHMSSGEKQRIALARIFLHDADMILLDEPTSNLDTLNEAVVLKSLKQETEYKTVVLVSHRESTMKIADEVLYTSTIRNS